jgi:hypothetical protein
VVIRTINPLPPCIDATLPCVALPIRLQDEQLFFRHFGLFLNEVRL